MQMFLWNNIFFSLGFDVKDHYKDFGGDAAAYAAPVSYLPYLFVDQIETLYLYITKENIVVHIQNNLPGCCSKSSCYYSSEQQPLFNYSLRCINAKLHMEPPGIKLKKMLKNVHIYLVPTR